MEWGKKSGLIKCPHITNTVVPNLNMIKLFKILNWINDITG